MLSYYLIALSAVILTAFCQLLLKLGAIRHRNNNSITLYLNFYTLPGYFFLLVAALLNTYAYRYIPLKAAVILVPNTFILVALLSYWILKEKISRNQLVGFSLIVAGIVVFNL